MKKTLYNVVKEFNKNVKPAGRSKGKKVYWWDKNIQWQKDIIYEAHLGRFPCNDIYEWIKIILEDLVLFLETDATYEDAIEIIMMEYDYDMEPIDVIEWIGKDTRNIDYLTLALKKGIQDGFEALKQAQKLYIQEIGSTLIIGIAKYIDSKSE